MASNSNIEILEEKLEELEGNRLFDAARKVLLAGIGALALSKQEIEDFVERLVERGEIAESDGRRLVNEVMEKRASGARRTAKRTAKRAEKGLDKRMEEILHSMNVPTKADIDKLSRKVATLSRKVDELKKAQTS